MINQTLKDIMMTLNHDATNYSVFLQAYDVPIVQSSASDVLIRGALGAQAVLGDIEEIPSETVWPEVERALFYSGCCGAGPSNSILASGQFLALIDQIKSELLEIVSEATKIEQFWLQDGHPAYPVFWDFAYLFTNDAKAIIFIGSSSD